MEKIKVVRVSEFTPAIDHLFVTLGKAIGFEHLLNAPNTSTLQEDFGITVVFDLDSIKQSALPDSFISICEDNGLLVEVLLVDKKVVTTQCNGCQTFTSEVFDFEGYKYCSDCQLEVESAAIEQDELDNLAADY